MGLAECRAAKKAEMGGVEQEAVSYQGLEMEGTKLGMSSHLTSGGIWLTVVTETTGIAITK